MALNTPRITELLTDARARLAGLTRDIDAHDRAAAQLRRDALATHGAIQVLELLEAEAASPAPPAEVLPLPADAS